MEIRSVAQLLQAIRDAKLPALDASPITHTPTIGDMYEGLSGNLLSQALPADSDLRVVTGFITDGNGALSGQIDRMLVAGAGAVVPETDAYVWHVRDVVAVLEIKKTLNSTRLADAYDQLLTVRKVERNWTASRSFDYPAHGLNMDLFRKIFSQTTGLATPSFEQMKIADDVPRLMYNLLLNEQISPLRIIIGYHGWGTEVGFRRAMYKLLESRIGLSGYGPGGLPHLIACGNYSLVKANGHPYLSPMRGDVWDFYLSMSGNPLLVLLELVWTRLRQMGRVRSDVWGEDLSLEVGKRFLSATPGPNPKGGYGWTYSFWDLTAKQLVAGPNARGWQPFFLSEHEFKVLTALQRGEEIRFDDLRWSDDQDEGQVFGHEVQGLLDSSLVAVDGDRLVVTCDTLTTAHGPAGEFLAADDAGGRFTRWLVQAEQGLISPLVEPVPTGQSPEATT